MKAVLPFLCALTALPCQAQTLERLDLAHGSASSAPGGFARFGERVAFHAVDAAGHYGIWTTDGTAAGTTLLVSLPDDLTLRSGLASTGTALYFTASSVGYGFERLWTTDGTASGTVPLTPIGVAVGREMAVVGTRVFVSGQTGPQGSELWASDGTPETTRLVRDISPGTLSARPSSMKAVGARLYFTADDGVHGREVWYTDGTAAGTAMLANLTPDEAAGPSGGSWVMGAMGETLILVGRTYETGREPWSSDGTTQGTRLLRDIAEGVYSSDPTSLTPVGSLAYFIASAPNAATAQSDYALWRTDGTPEGTVEVVMTSGGAGYLSRVGSRLFFLVNGSSSTGEVWTSDGTEGGTRSVGHQEVQVYGTSSGPFAAVGDRAYFFGKASYGWNLWESDGTDAGTHPVDGVPTIASGTSFVQTVLGNRLLFRGRDAAQGEELWILTPATGTSVAPSSADAAPTLRIAGTAILLSGLGEHVTVDAYDVLGRHVSRLHQGAAGPQPQHLRLPSDLAPGLYVVRATDERGRHASVRVVVTR